MNHQHIERTRIMRLASLVFVAVFFSSMLWAAESPAKPGSSSPESSTENAENLQAFYVRYARGQRQRDAVRAAVENAGGRRTYELPSVSTDVVMLTAASAKALSERAGVELVEPVPEYKLAAQSVPYNIDQYQARDIWDTNRDGVVDDGAPDGSGMKLCIIDSGLYATHQDFAGVKKDGVSQVSGETWDEDGYGHGTHVAGTANAVHNDVGVVGVMPGGAELYIVKVFNKFGQWTSDSNLGAAAIACQENGANVINMSLSGGGYSATEEAIFQDLYDNHGILNIASAGNRGNQNAAYPASYGTVVSVAAIDSDEKVASFSQHPPTIHDPADPPANTEWDVVEFSGGGVDVESTWKGGETETELLSGTSMAAPGVAAGAALVWNACGGPTGLTNKQIRQLLRDSAKDLRSVGWDQYTGWGLVKLRDAIQLGSERYGWSSCPLGLEISPPRLEICGTSQSDAQFTITLNDDFASTATMTASGVPPGASASFSPNPVGGSTTDTVLTLSGLDGVASGTYDIEGNATDDSDSGNTATAYLKIELDATAPAAATLQSPADGSADVPANPSLSWAAVSDASSYRVEMATDPAFINIVQSATVSDTVYSIPDGVLHDNTVYYWRVITPANICGDEATSSTFSFTTRSRILACSKQGVAIPGESSVDDLLSVGASETITDVDVYLRGSHFWVGDLTFTLTHPDSSTQAVLVERPGVPDIDVGCGEADFDLWLDDEGIDGPVDDQCGSSPALFGEPTPTNALSVFDGLSSDGDWTLTASSYYQDGSIAEWCLAITYDDSGPFDVTGSVASGSGSVSPPSQPVAKGETTILTVTPDSGWTIDSVSGCGGSLSGDTYTTGGVDANCWVSASFAINSYALIYTAGANGSVSGTTPQTVDHGSDGMSVEAVPDTNYHFVQWSDGSTDNPRTDANVMGNITVEAVFSINTYQLTYTAGANGSISGDSSQTVEHGSDGTSVEAVPNTGYHFVQWSDGSTENPRTDASLMGDIAVEAVFSINTYQLTYTAGANGSVSGTTPQTVDHGGDGTSVEAVPDSGYVFSQWSDGSTVNPRKDAGVASDVTVEAEFLSISIFSDNFGP